jgi:hypothetical protein
VRSIAEYKEGGLDLERVGVEERGGIQPCRAGDAGAGQVESNHRWYRIRHQLVMAILRDPWRAVVTQTAAAQKTTVAPQLDVREIVRLQLRSSIPIRAERSGYRRVVAAGLGRRGPGEETSPERGHQQDDQAGHLAGAGWCSPDRSGLAWGFASRLAAHAPVIGEAAEMLLRRYL